MPDSVYRPPTRVVAVDIPWLTVVQKADPEFERRRRHEWFYGPFENGRVFYEDPMKSGAYGP